MPGPVLHVGAVVMCGHGGQANSTSPMPRVRVMGQPVTVTTVPYTVAGCAFAPPGGNGPCVTGQWILGATRVKCFGQPLALLNGVSICAPTGTPLVPVYAQARVIAM
jgi:hypothetical protein